MMHGTSDVFRWVRLSVSFSCLLTAVGLLARPTDVLFNFDTEDYTADYPNDAIRDLANLLTEEGVIGQFYVVGYLAQRLQHFGRTDVIKALKPHIIGSQSLYHSRHPALCEYTDIPDAELAYRRAMREEAECVGMLKSVFDLEHVDAFCPPGNSVSYAAMEAYVDLGMRFYVAGGSWGYDMDGFATGVTGMAPSRGTPLGLWYFNMYQIPYLHSRTFYLEQMLIPPSPEPDYKAVLDKLAGLGYCGFYMHPNQAVCLRFWDDLNYREGKNARPWGEWIVSPRRRSEDTETIYRRLREFIRAIRADSRFRITNLREIGAGIKPRRTLRRGDLAAVRRELGTEFGPISNPGSYSVSDVFLAVVGFLRGDAEYHPGRVFGFLSEPTGVVSPVRVRSDDIRQAAIDMDVSRYLPASIQVGERRIGPADFLYAALEILTTGAEETMVTPRDQLGSFSHVQELERHVIAGLDKWCVHSPEFTDKYLSERLRYQLWTVRHEE